MPETASQIRDRAIDLMRSGRFAEAYPIFGRLLAQTPADGSLDYMAGQCARFMHQYATAVSHLRRAVSAEPDQPSYTLALGIALQMANELDDAIEAFRVTLQLDPDMELAYNSLALTQKKMGEFELALHNYDGGIRALTRRLVKGMTNSPTSRLLSHRYTSGHLWNEYAVWGATYLAAVAAPPISELAFPTGQMAIEEERTRQHRGLLWVDSDGAPGATRRLYLPNYFNTYREALRADAAYANLLGNRGTVLDLMGRSAEARLHLEEAEEFLPRS